MRETQSLARRKRGKIVFWYPLKDKNPARLKARKLYLESAEVTVGEVKEEQLK